MLGISYWVFPLLSGIVWLAMLLAMLLYWITNGSPHLPSFSPTQDIAYISDVGAWDLKPLFIAMSAVTVVTLDLTLILERYLRHTGRLTANTSPWQKALSVLSIIASIVGAAGLILLSIFDTLRHHRLHNVFLVLFIVGYVLSAIFICWQFQRLGIHYRQHRILRLSFWVKLFFILVEIALAIAFGVLGRLEHYDAAAVIEWVIALVFTFYVFSFAVDFLPALRGKDQQRGNGTEVGAAEQEAGVGMTETSQPGGRYYGHESGAGYGNAAVNGYGPAGYTNGSHSHKPPEPLEPSRNF